MSIYLLQSRRYIEKSTLKKSAHGPELFCQYTSSSESWIHVAGFFFTQIGDAEAVIEEIVIVDPLIDPFLSADRQYSRR